MESKASKAELSESDNYDDDRDDDEDSDFEDTIIMISNEVKIRKFIAEFF